MQTISTTSTRERFIRNLLVTLMLIGYAAWSFYDGYVGYPQDNLKHARAEVPAEFQAGASINPLIQQGKLPRIKEGETLREAEARLGKPVWKGRGAEGLGKAVWFGPGGTFILRYNDAEVVTSLNWKSAKHTETDLRIQKAMGIGVGALGLYALTRVLVMLFGRVKLSDDGLTTAGGRLIRYEAMSGWDPADFRDKGRITLSYQDNGRTRAYVLDDYKLAAFKPMVEEICARKGYANPLLEQQPPATQEPESSPG
jgi:hypothetical protein